MKARALQRAVSAVLAALILVLAIGVPTLAQPYEPYDLSGNGVAETWIYDDDGDGQLDRVLFDGDENRIVEMVLYVAAPRIIAAWLDRNQDGFYDYVVEPSYYTNGTGWWSTLWVDSEQNGLWENVYYDEFNDGHFEWVEVDSNYDGSADTWFTTVAPQALTGVDIMTQQMVVMMSLNSARAMGNGLLGNTHIPLCC